MKTVSYLLLAAAIIGALFADVLDRKFDGHKKLRFVILAAAAGVAVISLAAIFVPLSFSQIP